MINNRSRSEFAAIFSRFGKVAHSVILATVDNASRRRGFVVMASHEDAKCAMRGLTHTQIKYVLFSVMSVISTNTF